MRRQTLLPLQEAEVFGEGLPEPEKPSDEELAEAHVRADWLYEPEAEELLPMLFEEYVGPLRLPGAARVRRLGARGADDGDAERGRERAGDDRAT